MPLLRRLGLPVWAALSARKITVAALTVLLAVSQAPAASWKQSASVAASNKGDGDQFGFALALSRDGNTLAVGAPLESSAATGINGKQADDSAFSSGAVYVYTRAGNGWPQQAYVKPSNTGENDQFGFAVSLSADGNTMAVSAVYEDSSAKGINGNQSDNSIAQSGAVYVFTRTGSNWMQQAYIKASNTGEQEDGDTFGYTISLSGDGNTLAVGAPSEDSAATEINCFGCCSAGHRGMSAQPSSSCFVLRNVRASQISGKNFLSRVFCR